ncbi:hypothetical protein Leryth_017835 [Lithospermum erythrorhizon]|nr:hypothetical protein Leryth_017835 [Lithospermum erythrorhizon]
MDCSLSHSIKFFAPNYATTHARSLVFITTARSSSSSYKKNEYSGLHAPLELKTEAGRFLSGVFLNDKKEFKSTAKKMLEQVGFDRDQALARRDLSIESDEAFLHRRIAELKELQCQTAVEDIMYLMIVSKFSEIKVHLIPRLSRCIYNGRVEILPSKDYQLESIHSFDFLEMIREHLATVVGWRCNSNVKDAWATTKIQRLPLCQMYAASILYGYFLKSASLRHHLEQNLGHILQDIGGTRAGIHTSLQEIGHLESRNISFGHINGVQSTSLGEVTQVSCTKNQGRLKGYVMRFDTETMAICAKPWSKESVNLIQRHSNALFGEQNKDLFECNDMIHTSFATLKRFALEAIAFGSFLWDAEEYVNTVYKLSDNLLE